MSTVDVLLGFIDPAVVTEDHERPPLRRAPTQGPGSTAGLVFEPCRVHDIDASANPPGFVAAGFESVRLTDDPAALAVLDAIRRAPELTDELTARFRAAIDGTTISLADGSSLHIDHVAEEGVFVRVGEPKGSDGRNDTATNVHIDQDVSGTPLRQIFSGAATEVFNHEAPDSSNRVSQQFLVNVWVPLQQITRPLALLDGQTLDRLRHQVRFGLQVETFLGGRDEDQTVNDIWTCLHDEGQRWWFRSDTQLGDAYVFNTLSTAHGAFALPGEDLAASRSARLAVLAEAIRDGRPGAIGSDALAPLGADVPSPLRAAIERMDTLIEVGESPRSQDWIATERTAWLDAVQVARDAIVRRSIECRCVVTRSL